MMMMMIAVAGLEMLEMLGMRSDGSLLVGDVGAGLVMIYHCHRRRRPYLFAIRFKCPVRPDLRCRAVIIIIIIILIIKKS